MERLLSIFGILISIVAISGAVYASPVSKSDLWQNATITNKSSQHSAGPLAGMFDGNEGGYGYENGNALFGDSGAQDGLVHWVEWSTGAATTLLSLSLIAYHDFDDRNITHRGFSNFNLYYNDGSSWVQAFNWTYADPNGDRHYGGGPSYYFDPDDHDMNRSYLELTANFASPVTAQLFRAEFTPKGNNGGPRIVELDGYDIIQSVPIPATMLLFGSGLVGLAGLGRMKSFKN